MVLALQGVFYVSVAQNRSKSGFICTLHRSKFHTLPIESSAQFTTAYNIHKKLSLGRLTDLAAAGLALCSFNNKIVLDIASVSTIMNDML